VSSTHWTSTFTYVAPDRTVYISSQPGPVAAPTGDARGTVARSLLIAGLVAIALAGVYRWRRGIQVRRLTS
jgi:hypothetical protein